MPNQCCESCKCTAMRSSKSTIEGPGYLKDAGSHCLGCVLELGHRNTVSAMHKRTVLAPYRYDSFMMDCDTTGIRTRHRIGQVTSNSPVAVCEDHQQIGPSGAQELGLLGRADRCDRKVYEPTIRIEGGSPHLKTEHLPVFDCAFTRPTGREAFAGKHKSKCMQQHSRSCRGHQQDGQHAKGKHCRRHRQRLLSGVGTRPQSGRHLPRRFEAKASHCRPSRKRKRQEEAAAAKTVETIVYKTRRERFADTRTRLSTSSPLLDHEGVHQRGAIS